MTEFEGNNPTDQTIPNMSKGELLERLHAYPLLQAEVLERMSDDEWNDYLDSIGVVTSAALIGEKTLQELATLDYPSNKITE